MRLLGLHEAKSDAVTEDDITGMLREGADAGLFEKTEHDIVTRALRLDDQRLAGLMTPRTDLEFIDLNDPVEQILVRIADSPYSRFPVCRGDRSQVIGIVHAGDLFEQAIRSRSLSGVDIAAVIKPPLYVPESLSAMDLLETLKKNRAERVMVVDEFGEMEGMVTLNDVLGALVGDVSEEGGEADADAVQREDGSWLMDGRISFQRFREVLDTTSRFPEESAGAYHTLAGFVLTQFGHIPVISETFEWEGYRFEVMDMDRNRIDRLLVSRTSASTEPLTSDNAA